MEDRESDPEVPESKNAPDEETVSYSQDFDRVTYYRDSMVPITSCSPSSVEI